MNRISLILVILIYSTINIYPQTSKKSSEPIKLIYADSLTGMRTEGGSFRQCFGNVRLQQGNVYVTCDRADQFLSENRSVLIGNVVITQDTLILKSPKVNYDGNSGMADSYGGVTILNGKTTLTADKGLYSTKTNIAEFESNVVIDDDSARIFCDKVVYNRNTEESDATGKVLIKGKYTNTMLLGDTIQHFPHKNYTKATGNPILIQIDTLSEERSQKKEDRRQNELLVDSLQSSKNKNKTGFLQNDIINKIFNFQFSIFNYRIPFAFCPVPVFDSTSIADRLALRFDTLTIVSDTMEAFLDEQKEIYFFKNNVEIVKGSVLGNAKKAEFDKKGEIIKLYGAPIVWYDSTQLWADSTTIYLQNKKLKEISAVGNAFTGSRDDTLNFNLINQLSGDSIKIEFQQDSIRRIVCLSKAKSLYFMGDSAGTEGAARNGSDTIHINFIDGEADEIFWLSGVEGEFLPINILNRNPKDYFLPSYRWSDRKPKKQVVSHGKLK